MEGLYDKLLNSKSKYNPDLIVKLIDLNRKKSGQINTKTKWVIFFMLRKIVLKGVNQFISTCNNRGVQTPYEREDIVIEVYFVFEKCLEKFDTGLDKNFYLYFNSAVARRMTRMANYKSTYDPDNVKLSLDEEIGSEDGDKVTRKDFISDDNVLQGMPCDLTNNEDIIYLGFKEVDIVIMKSLYNKETRESISRQTGLNRKQLKERIDYIKRELGDRYGY